MYICVCTAYHVFLSLPSPLVTMVVLWPTREATKELVTGGKNGIVCVFVKVHAPYNYFCW